MYKGATALVTGASKGLGTAYARELAARGMNLVLVARSIAPLRELATSLSEQHGVTCVALAIDLAAPDAVQRIEHELDHQGLTIDLLVNNAGLGLTGTFLSHDVAAETASVQVNVQALIGLSHAIGTRMAKRGHGGIINIASNASFQPLPNMATYAASKAFVLSFSEAFRQELRGSGVDVMAVCPGPTATHFFDGVTTNMKAGSFDTPERVVRGSLQAFDQGLAVSYPGRFSVRVATWLPRFLPRNVTARAGAMATRQMGLAA